MGRKKVSKYPPHSYHLNDCCSIEVGYGYMLKRTGVDKYNKRCFVFYKNPVIEDIKTKADAESKEKYNNNYSLLSNGNRNGIPIAFE